MTNGWQTVQLAEVLKQDTNYVSELEPITYPKLSVKLYGKGVTLDSPTDGANVKMQRHQFAKPGQIIVSEIWAKKGAIGIVPPEGEGALVTSHFFLFDIDKTKIEPTFIGWFLKRNYFAETLDAHAHGTTGYAAVRPKQFLALEIPLPPLTEQRRIVAHIESLAARVNEAQRLREEAAIETNAYLLSAYHQVFQLKENWAVAKIGDFCDNPQYGYTESAKSEPVGPKFLRITDIQDGKVNWDSVPYCECPEPGKYLLKPNDIVFARTGATTGKSFLIRECPESVFASYLIRLRVLHTVTPDYLYAFFQSPDYWQQVIDEKKGTGQPNVNGQKLINIRVPVPPLDEQRRIVAYLDGLQAKVNALRELQSASGDELSALMPSILDKAFKGQL
jgi:type I restriction enzyme, S subunit